MSAKDEEGFSDSYDYEKNCLQFYTKFKLFKFLMETFLFLEIFLGTKDIPRNIARHKQYS